MKLLKNGIKNQILLYHAFVSKSIFLPDFRGCFFPIAALSGGNAPVMPAAFRGNQPVLKKQGKLLPRGVDNPDGIVYNYMVTDSI